MRTISICTHAVCVQCGNTSFKIEIHREGWHRHNCASCGKSWEAEIGKSRKDPDFFEAVGGVWDVQK